MATQDDAQQFNAFFAGDHSQLNEDPNYIRNTAMISEVSMELPPASTKTKLEHADLINASKVVLTTYGLDTKVVDTYLESSPDPNTLPLGLMTQVVQNVLAKSAIKEINQSSDVLISASNKLIDNLQDQDAKMGQLLEMMTELKTDVTRTKTEMVETGIDRSELVLLGTAATYALTNLYAKPKGTVERYYKLGADSREKFLRNPIAMTNLLKKLGTQISSLGRIASEDEVEGVFRKAWKEATDRL